MDFGYSNPDDIKKIIVDPVSHEVHLILPVFPLGKVASPPDDFAIDDDFENAYNELKRSYGKADLTLMKTLDNKFAHPRNDALGVIENYKMQAQYSIGKYESTLPKPDHNNVVWGSYNVTDPIGKKVVLKYKDSYNKGVLPLFTSSQIARDAKQDKYHIRQFDLMHTTLTDGPAFGEELSKVGAVCQGDVQSCLLKFNAASDKSADVGMNIHGDVIDLKFPEGDCPFCIETELTQLFENNLKNSDYILNSGSNNRMASPEDKAGGILKPDADQSANAESRAPIDTEKLAAQVSEQVSKLMKQNEVGSVEEAKEKTKKEAEERNAESKPDVDISNHPAYKKLEVLVTNLAKQVEDVTGVIKQKDEKLSVLEAKDQEVQIGETLAKYQRNFYDPETKKVDPAKWEEAFKYAKENKITPTQMQKFLEILSPYGTKPVEIETIVQKASVNRGVPKYGAAFEGDGEDEGEEAEEGGEGGGAEAKKIHSASRHRNVEVPKYMRLMGTIVRNNDLD